MFYETPADLIEATVGYFKAGLDQGDLCIWAVSDPVTESEAKAALYSGIPNLDRYIDAGDMSVTSGEQWRLRKDEFNLQRITGGWSAKLLQALDAGYTGLRISGNAAWLETLQWKQACAYDQELDRSVAGRQIILLCTQAISGLKAKARNLPAQAHHFTIACSNGEWTFIDPDALGRDIDDLGALEVAADQFAASLKKHHAFLTHREKAVLNLIVRGVSSKKGGQMLGISPRTIEFHRSNIMQKLNVRNVAELVHTVMQVTK
jgi:DNA-binding CsgD family transcriptional regulator